MPRQPAPTYASGGGGFTFADKVGASFFAQMLRRAFPLEPGLGPIVEMHFETRDLGQVFDDLMLVLKCGDETTRCAISVKSNRQLTSRGFNGQFVKDAWEHWRGAAVGTFDPQKDLLVLVTGVIGTQTIREWWGLQKQDVSTTPERMLQRLADFRQSSTAQRAIFESLCQSVSGPSPDRLETARLASAIRVLPFSEDTEGDSVNRCAEIVFDGSLGEATKLWARLQQIASESRATGAYFDLSKLVGALRPEFELRDYPDFQPDWRRIDAISSENLNGVRSVIGKDIRLARTDEKKAISAALLTKNIIIIAGESGSGKSALVSQIVADRQIYKRVLWLEPAQLSKSSQTELGLSLGLRYGVRDLVRNSALRDCVLVVDAFEKFEGDARRRMAEIMAASMAEGSLGWKVIITCQPQVWESVRDAVIDADLSEPHRVNFDRPQIQEIYDAVRHLPNVRALIARSQLQPILRNLVVLDWVLRAELAQRFSDSSRPWIGETEFIDCVWDHWIGNGEMRFARDSLLRRLGQDEGEKLSGAVHIESIAKDQLPLLGSLKQEGLIRVNDLSVRFSHDLMGDWARFRALAFTENQAAEKIKAVAPNPRWGYAIRLYSQSLVEKGHGPATWNSFATQLAGADAESQLASDLFLDGLLFAANSEPLLEEVWQNLIADDGVILRRLIKRLQYVASIPDPRLYGLVNAKLAEQSEAWFRIPHPLYWYPALCVLSRHPQDVCKYALLEAAEICTLWLKTMPDGLSGRREASLLALELSKEAQDRILEGAHFDEKDQIIYEALLLSAKEFPNEAAEIALELCARRDIPDHAIRRAVEAEERRDKLHEEWMRNHPEEQKAKRIFPSTMLRSRGGQMRPPDADGPLREVPDGFRAAVLETTALNALVGTIPAIAEEILLAVCIDEPKPLDPYENRVPSFESHGLADWRRGYPTSYWKGPFLQFLKDAPEHGLDTIVRLVNYTTRRWLEDGAGPGLTEEQRKQYGLEFDFDGKKVCWIGDAYVYGWNRSVPSQGPAVECALMALEKWFYDELESGRSIAPWIKIICDHAESLAFAGVLVSVGLKHQLLFTQDLKPLLGNFHIYDLQLKWTVNEGQEAWRILQGASGQPIMKMDVEWHKLPHRRLTLQEVAPWLMLQDAGLQSYLAIRVAEWSKRLETDNKGRDALEFFLANFDPQNYKKIQLADGTFAIEKRLPPDLSAKSIRAQQEGEIRLLSFAFASTARAYLSGQRILKPQELEEFSTQIQRIANWHAPDTEKIYEHCRINSLAGGIAVLLVQYRDWLSGKPELEKWCIDTLRGLAPPDDSDHDSPESTLDHTAESFLGEVGVHLLQESCEEWVLRLAFDGVTGFYLNSTTQTMWAAYLSRGRLGEKFGELVNIVVFWSALRHAANRESGYQANRTLLAKYKASLFRRYAAGELRGSLVPLGKAETLGRRLVERILRRSMSSNERRMRKARENSMREQRRDRKLRRDFPDVDLGVIQSGFAFLRRMVRDSHPSEIDQLQRYVCELYEMEMRTLPRLRPGDYDFEVEGTPYQFDNWVMALVAEFLARSNSIEIARTFYRPILEFGPAARYWVEEFLQAWVSLGLEISTNLSIFATIWEDMVEFTMSVPTWQPAKIGNWCRAESLAVDLMGLHEASVSVLGRPKYADLVRAMTPSFYEWGNRWLRYGSVAAWFAHFLTTESARVLLSQGTKQLADVLGSFEDRDWYDHGLGALLAETISACWKQLRNDVELEPDLRAAFLKILTELCARQIPEALHLRSKVSKVLGGS